MPEKPEQPDNGNKEGEAGHDASVHDGERRGAPVQGRALPVQFLCERPGLTAVHVDCGLSRCGACAVHADPASNPCFDRGFIEENSTATDAATGALSVAAAG